MSDQKYANQQEYYDEEDDDMRQEGGVEGDEDIDDYSQEQSKLLIFP